jgi:hypothetical protein
MTSGQASKAFTKLMIKGYVPSKAEQKRQAEALKRIRAKHNPGAL